MRSIRLTPDAVDAPGATAGPRTLHIKHKTDYQYDKAVERSKHRFHLRPIEDSRQKLLDHVLRISANATPLEFEDPFGNPTIRLEINEPYTRLTIESESTVRVERQDPFDYTNSPTPRILPISWLPSEQVMLTPFLTPPELPDTQLEELSAYAMSFVQKNNNDLMETLFAINLTLFREYNYLPGTTTVETTPFEIFRRKSGVCQDFTHLFICLARLLGVPARYVCGYIYTGNTGEQRAQSDASHAWVELYIPNAGWKGFDPTNGVLPTVDHVRLAYGRYYADAAPTSGTLFSPAYETLKVDVEVTEVK